MRRRAIGSCKFLDSRRLGGAKNALLLLLLTMFYVDYQVCIETKKKTLEQYKGFAMLLGRRMQRKGLELARDSVKFDTRKFYQGDVAFVSMNYDPILLWMQFLAHRELNKSPAVPHVGTPSVPLHVFNDFGHLIPSRSIEKRDADYSWYPMNEAVAQRLNELKSGGEEKVRLTKILFPHGSLCWRGCPNCGKLSAYHADQWDLFAPDLFPPPPLRAFDRNGCPERIKDLEKDERRKGRVDARACLSCGQLTFANHTQAIMQSSFKARPPSFIEEIQRDLRAVTMRAKHVIFMGYSLPRDDVTYRAFFAARRQRAGAAKVRCTIVNKNNEYPDWYWPDEIKASRLAEDPVVNAAQDVFGIENVRFFGGGVPDVFLDRGIASEEKLERLLEWQ